MLLSSNWASRHLRSTCMLELVPRLRIWLQVAHRNSVPPKPQQIWMTCTSSWTSNCSLAAKELTTNCRNHQKPDFLPMNLQGYKRATLKKLPCRSSRPSSHMKSMALMCRRSAPRIQWVPCWRIISRPLFRTCSSIVKANQLMPEPSKTPRTKPLASPMKKPESPSPPNSSWNLKLEWTKLSYWTQKWCMIPISWLHRH